MECKRYAVGMQYGMQSVRIAESLRFQLFPPGAEGRYDRGSSPGVMGEAMTTGLLIRRFYERPYSRSRVTEWLHSMARDQLGRTVASKLRVGFPFGRRHVAVGATFRMAGHFCTGRRKHKDFQWFLTFPA